MKDYYEFVKNIMTKYPDTRDDDMKLYAYACWFDANCEAQRGSGFYNVLCYHDRYKLPNYESVTRARRKVQEQEESLRGEKYNKRQNLREEYREHYQRGEDFVG